VVINATEVINFQINWGDDIGITTLNAESFTKDVSRTLTSQIVIPNNVDGFRDCSITDSKGGRYMVRYQVGDTSLLYNNGDSMLYNDNEIIIYN